MSISLIYGSLRVLAAAIVAMLPMRMHYVPGVALLIFAPILLRWIALNHGLWLFVFGMFAFLSMFRNPLIYFSRRAKGETTELPS